MRTRRGSYRARLAGGIPVTLLDYPDARHGFDIDPRLIYGYDRRYDPDAAADARRRILRALESTIGWAG